MIIVHASRYPDQGTISLYNSIKTELSVGKRCYFVVPSQYTVEAEKNIMEYFDTDILFDIQVKSFRSLENEILDAGYGLKQKRLSEAGRLIALKLILEDKDNDWKIFSKSVRKTGFLKYIADDLKEYKEYGITPEKLESIAETIEDASHTKEKLLELSKIYDQYEKRIDGKFLDDDDVFNLSISQIKELDIFNDVVFFFDKFHSMSKLELDAVEALSNIGCKVNIAITIDGKIADGIYNDDSNREYWNKYADLEVTDAEVFSLSAKFLKQIKEREKKIELKSVTGSEGVPLKSFSHAAKSVFSYANNRNGDENMPISIRQYRNIEMEIDAALIEIKKLIVSGAKYSDIQLILTDMSEYEEQLRRSLSVEKIPYFLDEKRSLEYHPLICLIQAADNIAKDNYKKEDVFKLLKTGLLGLNSEDIDIYQNFIINRKIDRYKFLNMDFFEPDYEYLEANKRDEDAVKKEFAVAKFINENLLRITKSYVENSKHCKTAVEYVNNIINFIENEDIQAGLHNYEEWLHNIGDNEALEEHLQIWDKIMEIFEQIVSIAGDETIDKNTFYELVNDNIELISVGIIPPYQDQVVISSMLRSRTGRRKYVFFMGAADQYLPMQSKKEHLLTDTEVGILRNEGYYLPSMKQFSTEEEKLAFYSHIVNVGEKLSFSYSMQNAAQEALVQSFWLFRMVNGFENLKIESVRKIPMADQILSTSMLKRTVPHILKNRHLYSENEIFDAENIFKTMLNSEKYENIAEIIKTGLLYNNKRNALSKNIREKFFGKTDTVSASQIERYANCPYQYFIDYCIRPKKNKTIDIDGLDIGNLLHYSIDEWTKTISEDLTGLRSREYSNVEKDLLEAFDNIKSSVADVQKRNNLKNKFVFDLTKKTLKEAGSVLYKQIADSEIDKIYHEKDFGKGKDIPALRIDVNGKSFYLEGRIDRLDRLSTDRGDYYQIVDYKSSNRKFQLEKVLGGLTIQLVLYLDAATFDEKEHKKPIGCFYLPLVPLKSIEAGNSERDKEKNKEKLIKEHGLLDGVIICDSNIFSKVDPNAFSEDSKVSSEIYTLKGRTGDFFKKDNVLTYDEMQELFNEVVGVAGRLLDQRNEGVIDVAPYRLEKSGVQTGCDYCDYNSICRFEKTTQFGNYRFISPIDWNGWREENSNNSMEENSDKCREENYGNSIKDNSNKKTEGAGKDAKI